MSQVGEMKSRISGFGARWQEVKPHGMPSGDPALMLLKMEDYSKQLTDLQQEAQQTAVDCAHFSMEEPDFSQLDTISDDISTTKVIISHGASRLSVINHGPQPTLHEYCCCCCCCSPKC